MTTALTRVDRTTRPVYQGEPTDPWHDRQLQARALKVALFTVISSARHYDMLRTSQDDFFWRWSNKPAKIRNRGPRRSNVPSGRTSEICDTFTADIMTTMKKSKTLIAGIPTEMADDAAANAAERLLAYRMANLTTDMGWWPVFDQNVNQAAIFGGSPSKSMWETRTISRAVYPDNGGRARFIPTVGYQGPVTKPIFVFDYYPHPHKIWAGDHYPHAHLTWENFTDLKSLEADGSLYEDIDSIPEIADMGTFLADKYGKTEGQQLAQAIMISLGDMYKRSEQRQLLGWTQDNRLMPDGILTIEVECMFRPDIDYFDAAGNYHQGSEPTRCIITVANGHVIRVAPTPVPTQDSIYQFAKFNHIAGQMWGMSLVQKAKPMIHVEEVLLNMMLTGVAQTLNRPKVIRRDLLEGSQSVDDRPGGVIMAKQGADINQVMREITTSPIGGEIMNLMSYIWGRSQGVSGSTDALQGRVSQEGPTATESNRAFAQISKRFLHAFVWFGATFVHPMAKLFWRLDQAFLPLPHRFVILGASASRYMRTTISAQEMAMQPDFMFMGPDRGEVDAVRVAQLQDLLAKTSAFMDFEWGQNASKDFLVKLAEIYDVVDLERFKERIGYDLPPSASMTMQLQMMQSMAAGGDAGGALGGGSDRRMLGQMPFGAGRADRRDFKGVNNQTGLVNSIGGALSNLKAA